MRSLQICEGRVKFQRKLSVNLNFTVSFAGPKIRNGLIWYIHMFYLLKIIITAFSVLNVYSWPTSSEVAHDPLKYIKCQITVETKY